MMKEGALSDLPRGWMWTTIRDISDLIHYGYTASSTTESVGPKMLRITDIQNNTVNWETVPYCKIEEEDKQKYLLSEGDLVFARTGATVGKSYLIRGKIPEVVFASYLIRIILSGNVEKEFVYNFFHSIKYWVQIREGQIGIGQPNVNSQILSRIVLPLPPLPEQRAIVSKIEQLFSDMDNGIENFKKAQAQLKLYRQSVLKAACEGKLVPTEAELARAEGREYESADVLLARILKERNEKSGKGTKNKEPTEPDTTGLPEMPEGWYWTRLGDITVRIGDVDHKMPKAQDNGTPYISTKDFTTDNINFVNSKRISKDDFESLSRKIKPEYGDILFSRYGTVGEIRKVEVTFDFQASYSIAIIKTIKNQTIIDYLFWVLNSTLIKKQIQRDIRATTQWDLGLEHIRYFAIPLPPLAEQRRIVAEVERRLSVSDKMEETITESLKKAESLRQSILKKAFEGKLLNEKELEKARNAPDWEPAEKLLERIRQEKQIKEKNNKSIRKKIHG